MRIAMTALLVMGLATELSAQTSRLVGRWLEPSGGVVEVAECGKTLCVTIVALTNPGRATHDDNNTDSKLRSRSLCGLRLGDGFVSKDQTLAENGHIYDPKTGKTYSAAMDFDGRDLRLRGFVGIKLFGKTEVWTPAPPAPACKP